MRKFLPFLLPIVAVFICSLPYLVQGYPLDDDSIHNIIRVKEYQLALANSQIPPYWAENLYGGYGSPIFLFYAPLYLFAATIFYLLTGSLITGSISAISFFTITGSVGIYRLVLEMLGEKTPINQAAGRIAGYFFILNPYLIGDKLIRSANSEYTALCLAPIALYGLISIKRAPLKGCLILAAGLALVILAHNLTALTMMAILIISALILYLNNTSKPLWLFILGGISLGLLISSFFWLPALYYKSLTHTEQLTQRGGNFHNQFKPLSTFFTNTDYFSMGLLNLWVIVTSFFLLWVARNKEKSTVIKPATAYLILAMLFIFLQTKSSLLLWENIPYMRLFQFPWRMMGPLALIIAILVGLLFPVYYKNKKYKSFNKLELIILILCVINTLPSLVTKLPVSETLIEELISRFNQNNLKSLIVTSTVDDEYLPKTAKVNLNHYEYEYSPLILNYATNFSATIIMETGTEIALETDSSQPIQLELKRWFFPGWKSAVNGFDQQVSISKNGLIAIPVSPGHNQISIILRPPFLRRLFIWVSFSALILWIILAITLFYREKTN
jgi:hypothetical protein